jgi:signal transduction histidine kinase
MSPFDSALLLFTSLSILSALYLPIALFALLRRAGQELSAGLIGLYALIGLALGLCEAFWRDGALPQLSALAFGDLESYGALSLALLLLLIVRAFMRRPLRTWLGVGAAVAVGQLIVLNVELKFPYVLFTSGTLTFTNDRLGVTWALLGWLIFIGAAAVSILSAYRQTRQPLLRNRLLYWLPVLLLVGTNDALILGGSQIPGAPLRLLATGVLAYAALTHDLPDLRQVLRRVLGYLITILLIMLFYLLGVNFVEAVFRALPYFNPLFLGAVMALLIALIFSPLLSLVRRLVDGWLRIDEYNPGQTLQEYSRGISNILDLERLASVAVGIIVQDMRVQRGFLFLVDAAGAAADQQTYRLRAVRSAAERPLVPGELARSGPIAAYFLRGRDPLLQYDLDLLRAFRGAAPAEQAWFRGLECEVYVPIEYKQQWIGLLAFGPKISGHRYTSDDLLTLSALGNQTAVALENARLVEDLMHLNTQLSQARRDLESTNRSLERLDQTKSDFISIASHELRTPLTVIKGYTEMLLENEKVAPDFRSAIQGIHDGTARLHEIMDSMFDLASIDARSLQLHLQPVDLGALLNEVCNSQARPARERKIALTLELPALPQARADPDSLRKVFQHLLSNAVKFTPNGGSILISGRAVPADPAALAEAGVEIIVRDSGVGVDPELRDLIFTRFYQSGDLARHSTSKSRFKGGGSGLGLALSKGIVEAHQGQIWVESPGYDETRLPGSAFHVRLPLPAEPADSGRMSPPLKVTF